MRILAFGTTGPVLSVGTAAAGKPLCRSDHPAERGRGNLLESLIDNVLRQTGWTRRDIEGLALLTGPGSLTALRIGWATAVGWAQSVGIPVVGWTVPNAHRRLWGKDATGVICCVHYRGDVFLFYDLALTGSPEIVHLDSRTIRHAPRVLTGPGVIGNRPRWESCLGTQTKIIDDDKAIIGADTLALWGETDLMAGQRLDIQTSPLEYGLPPDFRKMVVS
jgi:tRNA threonylcarbamoyl adenosine modification protein YeaZ